MICIENVSRRGFLKGVVGAGAFVLGVRLMPVALLAGGDVGGLDPAGPMNKAPLHPSVYVAIEAGIWGIGFSGGGGGGAGKKRNEGEDGQAEGGHRGRRVGV